MFKCSTIGAANILLKCIRLTYIGGAMCFVGYGYYTTILLAKEGTLLVKDEVKVLPKYRYPSVTFCYVFKGHISNTYPNRKGDKHVWSLYYHHNLEKWKRSGTQSYLEYPSYFYTNRNINFTIL